MRYLVFAAAAVLALMLVVLAVASLRTGGDRFVVVNRADRELTRVRIAAFGAEAVVGPIAPGASVTVELETAREGAFTIDAVFADGAKLTTGETGYVTPGLKQCFAVHVEVNEIGVETGDCERKIVAMNGG